MCDGGRIKHHLRYNLSRPECAIVFVGFQAEGTLGRRIVDGAETVRLFGEQHAVRAKVYTIGGLSAHADQDALLGWLGGFRRPPRATWVVHGEPLAAHALARRDREAPRVARFGANGASDGDAVERRVNGHPGAGSETVGQHMVTRIARARPDETMTEVMARFAHEQPASVELDLRGRSRRPARRGAADREAVRAAGSDANARCDGPVVSAGDARDRPGTRRVDGARGRPWTRCRSSTATAGCSA